MRRIIRLVQVIWRPLCRVTRAGRLTMGGANLRPENSGGTE
jgi:hypothetical protein